MNSDASPSSSAKQSAKSDTLARLLMLACCAVPAYICIDFASSPNNAGMT